MLQPFWIALRFLTRLPVPQQNDPSPEAQGHAVLYYPLIGLVIGLFLVVIAWLSDSAESILSAALVLAVWVAITGALHLDGLADSADAWVGGQNDRGRTLEIMKDPACGPMGVTAVVLVLLLKFAAITSLLAKGQWVVLLIAPLIGRAAIIVLFRWTSYVREQGLGALPYNHLPHQKVPWVLSACGLFSLLLLGWDAVTAIIVVGLVYYLLRGSLMRRIGGTTGDTAGAMIEIIEAVFLLSIAMK